MMTGQLLAGVDPVESVRYQIEILFLIASGTTIGTIGVVLLNYRRLFNAQVDIGGGDGSIVGIDQFDWIGLWIVDFATDRGRHEKAERADGKRPPRAVTRLRHRF